MKSYDPADPGQRARLESLMPGITESKMSIYKACQEQREFIASLALRLEASRQDFQRLVRILGGAERILIHPIDQGAIEALDGDDAVGGLRNWARQIVGVHGDVGIFSFFTAKKNGKLTGIGGTQFPLDTRGTTRAIRVYYATLCIGHFPRFVTGGYDHLGDERGRLRTGRVQAAKIVDACEAVVDELQPLGNVANEYVNSNTVGPHKAQRYPEAMLQNAFTE